MCNQPKQTQTARKLLLFLFLLSRQLSALSFPNSLLFNSTLLSSLSKSPAADFSLLRHARTSFRPSVLTHALAVSKLDVLKAAIMPRP